MMRFFLLAAALVAAMTLVSRLTAAAPEERSGTGARQASNSSGFSFRTVKEVVLGAWGAQGDHNTGLLAAGVAFYALFALFPGLGAATWIFGQLANPAGIQDQFNNLRDVLPAEAWTLIDQQLRALTSHSTSLSLAGIFSLFIAVYSARLAASSMMQALNTVYGTKETRGFFVTNGVAILFTLVAIALLLIAVAVLVVLPNLFGFLGLSAFSSAIIRYARWPALAVLMALALAVTYYYGPNRKQACWKWLTWGSAAATVLWLIASLGFSWYVAAFNSYDKVYGSIGAVAVLLFWFWISSYSGLLGAELDNAIEQKFGPPPVPKRSQKSA
jgi:membrane protein